MLIANPLETMFSSMKRDDFIDNHYSTNTPIAVHGVQEKLFELFEIPFLNSLEELFAIWPVGVNAYLPGLADEVNSQTVSSYEAKELLANGSGLYFDDPHRLSEDIAAWLESIKQDLGFPSMCYAQSLIYVIAKGQGTDAHFDQNVNFVLQISGKKKWYVAPNTHIENPLSRHTIGTPADPELASYAPSEMPDEFPTEGVQEYTLEAGSLLFLPRGAWHKTEALEESVSLNFTYSPPTWMDLLSMTIRSELSQSPKWRETANFLADPVRAQGAAEKFEKLIMDFSQDKDFWQRISKI